MASKQRITEIRLPRTSTGKHRSTTGGMIIGDYIDPDNGERVLTIKQWPVQSKAKTSPKAKASAASQMADSMSGVL